MNIFQPNSDLNAVQGAYLKTSNEGGDKQKI